MFEGPFARRVGRVLFGLLCGAGGVAGVFLLLYSLGVVEPEEIFPRADTPAVQTAAPVTVTEERTFRAVSLAVDDLADAVQVSQGFDGVVVTMKDPSGELNYVSALSLAADCGSSAADPDRNEAIRTMNRTEGLYTVAQVSCLRDDALAKAAPELTLKRVSGSPWRDDTGACWLDPSSGEVQTYLIGVCQELAQLGFDEIVLTGCAYPTQGAVEELRSQEDRAEVLETFCRRLQGALADFPIVLSVVGESDGEGLSRDSGQTAALLASFPGRVWSREEDQTALAVFQPVVLPE